MAGWDWKNGMSNNAVLAVRAGMIPYVALTSEELDRLYDFDDATYEAVTAPHHIKIDDLTMYVPFVEASAVGREPMTVDEVSAHLRLVWDKTMLDYKVAWE